MDRDARLDRLPATFTTAQARRHRVTSRNLSALLAADRVHQLSRGVYRRADAPESAHEDLIAVHTRAPHAVICGQSALALHGLIDDMPLEVHIAVPRGTSRPAIAWPATRVSQYAAETFSVGIQQFEAAPGETVPVYSPARAVVDELRLSSALAQHALNRYLRRGGDLVELRDVAGQLGVLGRVVPAVQAVLA